MILKKVEIDGKTVYEPIDAETALKTDRDLLVFTDEDEEEKFDERLEELEHADEDEDDFDDEQDEQDEDDAFGDFIRFGKNGRRFGDGGNKSGKRSTIVAALPFMSDEDLSQLVDDMIADPQAYKDKGLSPVVVAPFLNKEDCDRLFLQGGAQGGQLVGMAPFVSADCLDRFVDEYVEGKHPDAPIDWLYPFLPAHSLRKVFKHELDKRQRQ